MYKMCYHMYNMCYHIYKMLDEFSNSQMQLLYVHCLNTILAIKF